MKAWYISIVVFILALSCTSLNIDLNEGIELHYDNGETNQVNSLWTNDKYSEIAVSYKVPFQKGRLKSVKFFIPKYSKYNSTFEVRIYDSQGGRKYPNKLLLSNIFGKAINGNEWVSIDLEKFNIILNDTFFVSMRWLNSPGEKGNNAQLSELIQLRR